VIFDAYLIMTNVLNLDCNNKSQSPEITGDNFINPSTYSLHSYHLNKTQLAPFQYFKENVGANGNSNSNLLMSDVKARNNDSKSHDNRSIHVGKGTVSPSTYSMNDYSSKARSKRLFVILL
jgi:hypothetical protein